MAFQYLTKDNIFDRYQAAKTYTDNLTVPFPEFERIARNKPKEGMDKNYPKTTDGTTASIIRKTPKRVVQQLPTGEVENEQEDWLSIVADFILREKILLYANEEYDLLQKCWNTIEGALSFGATATYTPFLNHDGYMCPDVTLIYWGDIKLQPGKKSGHACKYVFVRSWWQKEDIEALIDRENKLAANAKKRKEKYEGSWDVKALAAVMDNKTLKDDTAKTPMEKDRNVNSSGVELITGFQDGIGADFITFSPGAKEVVRTEKNKDPRGKMPIDWMYGDIDGSNPFGRGIIELVGGLQNLIDADMQMYQYNRALMLAPPLVQYGTINNVRFVPNAVMKASTPDAKIEALEIDTSAVANYPQLYQLQQSQLFNLVQSPQSSISTPDASLGQGKTPTALNQQKATVSVDDNYVRKMFEAWFEDWAETAINVYFGKRNGIDELQLDEDTVERLQKLADDGKFDMTNVNELMQVRINYDDATPALKFRVDASTSKMKDDQDQLQGLELLQQALDASPVFQQNIPQDKVIGLWNSLVAVSGVENPEDLKIDPAEFAQQQAQAQAMQQQQLDTQNQQAQAQAQTAQAKAAQMQAPQVPQQMPQQPQAMPMPPQDPSQDPNQQLSPEDEAIVQELASLGVPDEDIAQAIDWLEQGMPAGEVMQRLNINVGATNG